MTGRGIIGGTWTRGVALALFVLAISLNIVFPAGFMAGGTAQGASPIVLCTGQGMALVDATHLAHHDKAPASPRADAPCAFAGHGLTGLSLAPPVVLGAEPVAYRPERPFASIEAAPGQGLPAPPPPARGPPRSI